MKSKMKALFAIIAVALMVMVAVVPMVSVFSGDSEAATKTAVDPKMSDSDKIVITGKVYNTSNTAEASNVLITYVAGSTYKTTVAATTGEGYSVTIYEKSVSSIKVQAVDDYGVAKAGYSEPTMSNVTSGSYVLDVKAGYNAQNVVLVFNGGASASNITTVVGDVVATYTVTVDGTQKSELAGKFSKTGTASINYPAGATEVKINVSSGNNGIDYVSAGYVLSKNADTQRIAANQRLIVMTTSLEQEVTVSSASFVSEGTVPSISILKAKIKTGSPAYLTYVSEDAVANTNVKFTVTADNSTYRQVTKAYSTSSGSDGAISLTYADTDRVLYGQVYMEVSNVKYKQAGKLGIKTTGETGVSTTDANVTAEGYYITFPASDWNTTASNVDYTFGTYKKENTACNFSTATNLDLLPANTFAVVSGNIYYQNIVSINAGVITTGNVGVVDKEFTVTGAATFGTLKTGANGAYNFLAEQNKQITIKPSDSSTVKYTGDVEVFVGSGLSNRVINMDKKEVSISLTDALGKDLSGTAKMVAKLVKGDADLATFVADSTNKVFKQYVGADVSLSNLKVYAYENTNTPTYTFVNGTIETAVAYEAGKAYPAEQATYELKFYKADGTTVLDTVTSTDDVIVAAAKVYKTSTGAYVYTYDDAGISTVTAGVGTFTTKKAYLDAGATTISSTPVDVIIVVKKYTGTQTPTASLDTKGIFKDYYILTSTSKTTAKQGITSVTASLDSFTASLVRNDGKTVIPGAEVKLFKGNATKATDTEYVQSNGKFTVYSDTKIDSTFKLTFSLADYDFMDGENPKKYPMFNQGVAFEKFKPVGDAYYAIFIDADLNLITYTAATVGGKTVNPETGKFTADFTDKTEPVTVTATVANTDKARSFEKHALTATEISTGIITLVSNQKTYTVEVTDASEKVVKDRAFRVTIQKYNGDVAVATDYVGATSTTTGEATFILPQATDDKDTKYGFVVTDNTNNPEIQKYEFTSAVTDIKDAYTSISSIYEKITISLRDAAGEKLDAAAKVNTTDAIDIYKFGEKITGTGNVVKFTANTDRSFSFVNNPEATFEFTIPKTTVVEYNFEEKSEDVLGFVLANEQWVTGDVVDALGNHIITADTQITAKYLDGVTERTGLYDVSEGNFYTILVDVDKVKTYNVTVTNYSFVLDDEPLIVANECTVLFGAVSATGIAVDGATYEGIAAYDLGGKKIGKALQNNKGIIVDVEDVVYYEATVTEAKYFANGVKCTSTTGIFVSNLTLVEGTVPAGTTNVVLNYYLDGELVMTENKVPAGGKYTAYIDVSMYQDETAGVPFDSIIADCYNNAGVLIASSAVDPTHQYNPIVIIPAPVITKQGSATVLAHYSATVVGGFIVLSADGIFENVVPTDVEGINVVEKYTFAAWYVDGEKVSTSISYTMPAAGDVAVFAEYTMTTYDVVTPVEPQPEPPAPVTPDNSIDPTVLVIGICAVVIALIAVAYVVLQGRKN